MKDVEVIDVVAPVTPDSQAAPEWEFRGTIPPAKVSPLYKMALAVVAVTMVLLPLLYLALVAGAGWATWYHATHHTGILTSGSGGGFMRLLIYLTPIICGIILCFFMIKPLFAPRAKVRPPLHLRPEDEPALFGFVHRICDVVGSPRPSRISVDNEVNASASFSRGMLSFFTGELTLTIGLPLARGMTLKQLAGVIAHELGHFAQGAGMRFSYVIKTVNNWFARLVYERDDWDERLAQASKQSDWRIAIVLWAARGIVWLVRKILWCFMMTGHALSCFMSRQMEYDADYYEAQLAGSDEFARTSERLHLLGLASSKVFGNMRDSYEEKRLVDDLPGLIALETSRIPANIVDEQNKAVLASSTGWFDTHPANADRIAAARRIGAPGVLRTTAASDVIFSDFRQLCQQVTGAFYTEECDIPLESVQLLSLEIMLQETASQEQDYAALDKCGRIINIFCPTFLSSADLPAPAWADASAGTGLSENDISQADAICDRLQAADSRLMQARAAQALMDAGFNIDAGGFGLKTGTRHEAQLQAQDAEKELTALAEELAPLQDRLRSRLGAGLTLFQHSESAEAQSQVQNLLSALRGLREAFSVMSRVRINQVGMNVLLENAEAGSAMEAFHLKLERLGMELEQDMRQVREALGETLYPFTHASGPITIRDFLRETSDHPSEIIRRYTAASAMVERFYKLYIRLMARLSRLSLQPQTEQPPQPEAPAPAVHSSSVSSSAPGAAAVAATEASLPA